MHGNQSSFKVDLGYHHVFHIPAVTSVSFKTYEGFPGTLCSSVMQIKAPYCLIGKKELLCTQCRGIRHHLSARGKSHGFSRVESGTWGIFSSYAGIAIKNFSLFSNVRTPV